MNKKSILYIFVVLMALSLTLGAVSAEDAAADVVAAEETTAIENAAGGDVAADVAAADVEVDVEVLNESDKEILWGVAAINHGPDTAANTVVRVDGGDNLALYGYFATVGTYLPEYGLWYVGDLAPNATAVLLLDTVKVDKGPYYVEALITSDTFDPVLSNNYDIAWADVPVSAAEETMPAAGNPIAMALLALIAIAGATFTRRF